LRLIPLRGAQQWKCQSPLPARVPEKKGERFHS